MVLSEWWIIYKLWKIIKLNVYIYFISSLGAWSIVEWKCIFIQALPLYPLRLSATSAVKTFQRLPAVSIRVLIEILSSISFGETWSIIDWKNRFQSITKTSLRFSANSVVNNTCILSPYPVYSLPTLIRAGIFKTRRQSPNFKSMAQILLVNYF